jgi:hypothetical protein
MNIRFLNLLKNRDEPTQVILHIYKAVPQDTPSVAILNKQKCHFFYFTKWETRRAEQVLSVVVGTSGRGKEVEKGHGRVNMVQMLCTHVCKWQNDTC